jgi:hypothetical protein
MRRTDQQVIRIAIVPSRFQLREAVGGTAPLDILQHRHSCRSGAERIAWEAQVIVVSRRYAVPQNADEMCCQLASLGFIQIRQPPFQPIG